MNHSEGASDLRHEAIANLRSAIFCKTHCKAFRTKLRLLTKSIYSPQVELLRDIPMMVSEPSSLKLAEFVLRLDQYSEEISAAQSNLLGLPQIQMAMGIESPIGVDAHCVVGGGKGGQAAEVDVGDSASGGGTSRSALIVP